MKLLSLFGLVLLMGCQVKLVDKKLEPEGASYPINTSSLALLNQKRNATGQVNTIRWAISPTKTDPDIFELRIIVPSSSPDRWITLKPLVKELQGLRLIEQKSLLLPTSSMMQMSPSQAMVFRVAQGSQWQLRVFCSEQDKAKACGEGVITIPSVLWIRGQHQLKQDFIWSGDFVIMQASAVVLTKGYQFNIEAEYLNAQPGSFIGTFKPHETTGVMGQAGQRPDNIRIVAQFGEGHLQIISRGQDGHKGSAGLPHQPAQAKAATPGPMSELGTKYSSIAGLPPDTFCRRSAAPGNPGERGLNGQSGGAGGNAGPSGSIELKIKSPLNFTYQVAQIPGQPGLGGDPGPVQKGGAPFVMAVHQECHPSGHITTPGGLDGQPGALGPEGLVDQEPGPLCIWLGNERQGCE